MARAVFGFVLAFAPALAAEPLATAALLARAGERCESLDYDLCADDALAVIARADATEAQRTQAHKLAGTATRVLGRDVEARMSFRWLLARDPDAQLDQAPPKIRHFFELVRQEMKAAGTLGAEAAFPRADAGPSPPAAPSVLEIVAVGPAVEVSVDGAPPLRTPLTTAVSPGRHELVLSGPAMGTPAQVALLVAAPGTTRVLVHANVPLPPPPDVLEAYTGQNALNVALGLGKLIASPLSCVGGGCLGLLGAGLTWELDPNLGNLLFGVGACCAGPAMCAGAAGWGAYDLTAGAVPAPVDTPVNRVEIHPPDEAADVDVRFFARDTEPLDDKRIEAPIAH